MASVSVREGRNNASCTSTVTADTSKAELLVLPGGGYLGAQVKATALTATIVFEITMDGTNWKGIELMLSSDQTDTSLADSLTNPTDVIYTSKGPVTCYGFRVRCSAFTSQTAATITARWSR